METNQLELLLVEDNLADSTLISELISDGDFAPKITSVTRLDEALRQMNSKVQYDLVLLDLGLPDSNGFDTFTSFKNDFPDQPVVILSGLDDRELSLLAVREGAQDYILKSELSTELLNRSVQYAVERWQFRQRSIAEFSRTQRIIEESKDAILICRPDGIILLANPAACDLFGLRLEKLLKEKLEDLLTETNGDQVQIEHTKLGKRFVEMQNVAFEWEGRDADLVNLRDVTDRIHAQEALIQNEERFRNTIDIADESIVSVDSDQKIILFNNGAERQFGYREEEVLGKPLSLLLPDSASKIHSQHIKQFQKTKAESRRMGERSEVAGKRKDGSLFPAEASISKLEINGQKIFTAILRDITDRKASEDRLKASRDEIERSRGILLTLNQAGQEVITKFDRNEIFKIVGKRIRNLGYQASIFSLTEDNATLKIDYLSFDKRLISAAEKLTGQDHKTFVFPVVKNGPFDRAFSTNSPIYVDNFVEVMKGIFPEYIHATISPFLNILKIEQGIIAPVRPDSGSPPIAIVVTGLDLPKEDVPAISLFAQQTAAAINNANLVQKLQASFEEISSAYDTTLVGWSKTLQLRDDETQDHTLRVAALTEELAKKFGVEAGQLTNIYRGAILHDIGKIGIPDEILLKPGPLLDDEWVIMKRHPQYAFDLLDPIEFLHPAIEIPYCHHEKWDGSGYPQGRSGEDIPFSARMFAVVDVFDALTTDRPYRKAWSKKKALAYIREQRGKHFDPTIADAFLEMKTPN